MADVLVWDLSCAHLRAANVPSCLYRSTLAVVEELDTEMVVEEVLQKTTLTAGNRATAHTSTVGQAHLRWRTAEEPKLQDVECIGQGVENAVSIGIDARRARAPSPNGWSAP